MSAAGELYQGVLMAHYRNPRNHGSLSGAAVTRRADNPLCGDQLEVGVELDGETLRRVRFRARGCAICVASGSLMTEAVSGLSATAARDIGRQMATWFGSRHDEPPADLPEPLRAVAPVRAYPSRSRCMLLAWEALDDALASASVGAL